MGSRRTTSAGWVDRIELGDLVPAIVDRLPVILADVRDLLAEQQGDYAQFIAGNFNEVLVAAEGFIARLLGLVGRDPATIASQLTSGVEHALFEHIGHIHHQQQRDITLLLATYRTGAVVAWRHISEMALRLGASTPTLAGLASAVFAAVEQLSAASLRGYFQAQTAAGHDRERRRHELAELLLSDHYDPAAIRAAAARAQWPLPRRAAVVLIEADNAVGRALLDRLDDPCLRLMRPGMLVAIVPDPAGPGRRKRLAALAWGPTANGCEPRTATRPPSPERRRSRATVTPT